MTAEMIINELQNRGYNAIANNVIKNGVELEGILIRDNETTSPIIYTESFIRMAEEENATFEEVIDAFINCYNNSKVFNFDINILYDKNFVLTNIYIGLQKSSNEELIKRECEELIGIESYLYIRSELETGEGFSIKVSKSLLALANISEQDAWNIAECNTNTDTSLVSLAKIVSEMIGMKYEEDMEDEIPLYVLSNNGRFRGASAILNRNVLTEFAQKHNTNKIVVLPSSIHEMIITPFSEDIAIDDFSSMVKEINNTQVDPTERLTDMAYIITL